METLIKEPWRELAERAAVEQDSAKLLSLMVEINRLLEEHEAQLAKLRRAESEDVHPRA